MALTPENKLYNNIFSWNPQLPSGSFQKYKQQKINYTSPPKNSHFFFSEFEFGSKIRKLGKGRFLREEGETLSSQTATTFTKCFCEQEEHNRGERFPPGRAVPAPHITPVRSRTASPQIPVPPLSSLTHQNRSPSLTVASPLKERRSGPSTRSQSRRGRRGRPPEPCGWPAGCRTGRPWRRRWTSRKTPSRPPASPRSRWSRRRRTGRSGTPPWPRSEAGCSIPARTGSGRRTASRPAAWSSEWWWWSRTRRWQRPGRRKKKCRVKGQLRGERSRHVTTGGALSSEIPP